MKKLLSFVFMLGLILNTYAQINFEQGTWAEAQAKATLENKMIFVDAYTTWCEPCKRMSKNTFTNKAVGEYYNANFINYKFDLEKGEGPAFATAYQINAYPTLLYLTSTGEMANRSEGSQDANTFLENGKAVLNNKGGKPNIQEPTPDPEWSILNEKAWVVYKNETDKEKLIEASKWALASMDIEQNYYNTDTYAHLLYKMGRKQEALKWAVTSVEIGKKAGENVKATKALILKIKNNR